MSAFYDRLATTATSLLGKFGASVTLGGPPFGGLRTAKGVRLGNVRHVLGDSGVQVGDVRLLLEPAASPVVGERVVLADGASLVIVTEPEPIKPADTVLGWYVAGRSG